jgi:hypothetical protein
MENEDFSDMSRLVFLDVSIHVNSEKSFNSELFYFFKGISSYKMMVYLSLN